MWLQQYILPWSLGKGVFFVMCLPYNITNTTTTCLLVARKKTKQKKSFLSKRSLEERLQPRWWGKSWCATVFLKTCSLCDASCPYITALPSDIENFAKMIGNCHVLQALPADVSGESLKALWFVGMLRCVWYLKQVKWVWVQLDRLYILWHISNIVSSLMPCWKSFFCPHWFANHKCCLA